ncbi:Transketolase, chloroplastic [Capsicum chinense]|nr:Transketolase, chloroplastic [Capsicum chinense]
MEPIRGCFAGAQVSFSGEALTVKMGDEKNLKEPFPFEISTQKWDDDEKFQEFVDKRCVDNVRMLIVDSVQHAKAGHAGMALGMAEVAYFLYRHAMRYNPTSPKWFNRDRFVLSAGHGCLLQYVCLHLARFQSVQVKTTIGKLSRKEGTSKAHHGTFDDDDVKLMKQKVKWDDTEPFHVIPMVYREMQAQADLGGRMEQEWHSKLYYYQNKYPEEAAEFKLLLADGMLPGWECSLPKWSMSDPVDSTRGYSGKCLNELAKVLPGLIGGSADLASSNQAYLHNLGDFKQPNSPWGRNIRYGVREHAMAGISNGLPLHSGGLMPFAATFLVFSDYMKTSIRLSTLSHAGVLYIFTQDSVGIGEDGPTHQPIEHLAGLRAIRHLLLFRPADAKETAGAYKVAIENRNVPSLLALSRQKVAGNVEGTLADAVGKGGYIVSDNSEKELPEIILIGSGSELCLCEASANVLRKEGRRVRVVSLVCWRLFNRQTRDYKELVLPSSVSKRVSVEAGSPLG